MSVTVWPSVTAWSGPAWTVGGALRRVMVMATWSVAVALWGSVAASVRMAVALESTCGAVKVVEGEPGSSKVMASAPSCDHR